MEGCSMEPYRSWKEENVVEHFIANRAKGKGIIGSNELTDFVEALKTPRVIL